MNECCGEQPFFFALVLFAVAMHELMFMMRMLTIEIVRKHFLRNDAGNYSYHQRQESQEQSLDPET